MNVKDNQGVTPLHIATQNGREKMVELLIQNGADVNAQDNKTGTPICSAHIRDGHDNISGKLHCKLIF